jgi:gamma-glutamyltranspeptidase/glutathione hydrolase
MVVCPEPLAAEAGAEILRRGGNAADAAVAAAFAQGVVDPIMCGIGGVATIIAHTAPTGRTITIQAKGVAGALARPDVYLSDVIAGQNVPIGETVRVRGDRNCMGYESVIVPGFVRGMAELDAWCGSGRVTWAELLAPAARLARQGFAVDLSSPTSRMCPRRPSAWPRPRHRRASICGKSVLIV